VSTKEQEDALTELVKEGQARGDYVLDKPPLFGPGEDVTHRKGGGYVILKSPDGRRLEYCGEQFYEYVSTKDNSVWIRRQSEMEDGRFTKTK